MKKLYETPVAKAESFLPNAYCGACYNNPTFDGTLHVTKQTCSNTYNGKSWRGSGYNLTHTFNSADKKSITATDGNGKKYSEYYWTCTDSDCNYFLEYTAGFTDRLGTDDLFILYQDANRNGKLDLGSGDTFPKTNRGADTAVAWAKFTKGTVSNS